MSLSLHNYAGDEGDTKCPHCVDLDNPIKGSLAGFIGTTIVMLITTPIVPFVIGQIFYSISHSDHVYNVAFIITSLLGLSLVFWVPVNGSREAFYIHYRADGRLHIHHENPLTNKHIPWIAWKNPRTWYFVPKTDLNLPDYVSGAVIRLVFCNGWSKLLIKGHEVLDNQRGRGWKIVSASDFGHIVLGDNMHRHNLLGVVMIDEALEIINRNFHITAYLETSRQLRSTVLPTSLAVMDFLMGTRKNKPSLGMGQARELLQAGFNLASGDNVYCLVTASERQAMLARLQAQVAEAEAQTKAST